jgi:hypothetical protein
VLLQFWVWVAWAKVLLSSMLIYKREGGRFHRQAWISVSQLGSIGNILRNMFKELYVSDKKKEI